MIEVCAISCSSVRRCITCHAYEHKMATTVLYTRQAQAHGNQKPREREPNVFPDGPNYRRKGIFGPQWRPAQGGASHGAVAQWTQLRNASALFAGRCRTACSCVPRTASNGNRNCWNGLAQTSPELPGAQVRSQPRHLGSRHLCKPSSIALISRFIPMPSSAVHRLGIAPTLLNGTGNIHNT